MGNEKNDEAVLQRLLDQVDDLAVQQNDDDKEPGSHQEKWKVWQLPGLTADARLTTDFGEVPSNLIRMRDKVRCADGRFLRVLRIQEYKLDQEFLDLHPHAKPVVIRKHALGRQLPSDTIAMSPAQTLVMPSDWSKRRTVRADDMSKMRGECDRSTGIVTYYSFDVGEKTFLQGEGLWFSSSTG